MDVNTMYAAAALGLQDEYDTQIVKDVWNNSMSNMNAGESTKNCFSVYEAQGSTAEGMCYQAGLSCGSDTDCNALAVKYAEALAGGYSKDFESFKKKSSFLVKAGEITGGILSGLLTSLGGDKDNQIDVGGGYYEPQKKSRTSLYIGIGVVAVIGIGVAIYFARKNK